MERAIISISENGTVNIPSSGIWMSEMELVELFGVIAPTLRAAIKAIYKNSGLCPTSTQKYCSVTSTSWATYYGLEVIVALAFRLNTCEANIIRQKVLERICQRKENDISLLVYLSSRLSKSHIESWYSRSRATVIRHGFGFFVVSIDISSE